jgi:hypothetical protein
MPASKCFASASMIPVPSPALGLSFPAGIPTPSSLTDRASLGSVQRGNFSFGGISGE